MNVLTFLFFVKALQQMAYMLYLLQIKEYRMDRLTEHIRRVYSNPMKAFWALTIGSPISAQKLPKITAKSVAIYCLSLVLLTVTMIHKSLIAQALLLAMSPLIPIITLWFIQPTEEILRAKEYGRAKTKIRDLKSKGLVVIGITGSYGKSSTKSFLHQLLATTFKVASTKGSINTPLGVSRSILKDVHSNTQFFIAEMGAYKIGEINEMVSIADPDISVLTGIGNQHVSLFGSLGNIATAKSEILEGPSVKKAFIHKGASEKAHIPQGLDVVFYSKEDAKPYLSKLEDGDFPSFMQSNLAAAIVIAKDLGVSSRDISVAVSKITTPDRTMEQLEGYNGALIIDDTFSSNTEGVRSALKEVSSLKKQNVIVVMTCLIELGDEAKKIHRDLGKIIGKHKLKTIVTTPEYFNTLKNGAKSEGHTSVILEQNPSMTISWLQKNVTKDTVVLLEGRIHPSITKFLKGKN